MVNLNHLMVQDKGGYLTLDGVCTWQSKGWPGPTPTSPSQVLGSRSTEFHGRDSPIDMCQSSC